MRNPVAQRDKRSFPSRRVEGLHDRFMAVPQNHGVIVFPPFFFGKGLHFFQQIAAVVTVEVFAGLGRHIRQRPDQRGRKQALEGVKKTAAQKSAERQIEAVGAVRRVSV